MAATGLLGINPYQKGVDIDFSTKPTNLAINLMQQDAARKEALDKYFMDYEKSLDPSGMREQDKNVFLNKLAETKQYYLKNRDKILNPAKYGAEAQSQLMSGYKGVLSAIDQSKQRAAQDRVIAPLYIDAKKNNRTIPPEVEAALERNKLSIGDPNHVGFDPLNFDAYDQHDPLKYAAGIYGKMKQSEGPSKKVWNSSLGRYEIETPKDYDKSIINPLRMEVSSELKKDRGLRDQVVAVANDPARLAQVAQAYQKFTGTPIKNTLEDIGLAYTLSLKPGATVEKKDWEDDYKTKARWQQNFDDELARKAVQGIGTSIVQGALNNLRPVKVINGTENWFDLPLPSNVMEDFKVPGVERTWVTNPNYNPKAKPGTPGSEEFISKPGTKQTLLPVNYVTVRDGKIYGFIKPVDANGNPVAGKADQIEIPVKVLAQQIVKKGGITDSKSAAGVEQVTKELEGGMKNILPKSSAVKQQIKASDIPAKAAASGYSPEDYKKLLIGRGVKIIY